MIIREEIEINDSPGITWLFGMGIVCIVAGLIIGIIISPMAFFNPILISLIFFNTFSVIGYIMLGTSLFLKYFKSNWRQQKLDTTKHFNSFRDYVEDKKYIEDQPSEE